MKRYSLVASISVLLTLAALTSFASPGPGGTITLPMSRGWFDDALAWFVSDDMSPALPPSASIGAPPVYILTNAPQGPVFSTAPGLPPRPPYYSGVWHVVYAVWNPQATRLVLTSQQQVLTMADSGAMTLIDTGIAIRYPIFVIGPLDVPMYVAPVVVGVDPFRALVELPPPDAGDQAATMDLNQPAGGGAASVEPETSLTGRDSPAVGGTASESTTDVGPFALLTAAANFPLTPEGKVLTDWSQMLDSLAQPEPAATQ